LNHDYPITITSKITSMSGSVLPSWAALAIFVALLCVSISNICAEKVKYKNEHETRGVVLLDAITFHKVVPSPSHAVLVLVCNKYEMGQYATDSIRADFFSFAEKGELQGEFTLPH
jgi:hypothetical protein